MDHQAAPPTSPSTYGSKLDATVVKNNLDAYRGTPGRSSLLFTFILTDVADTRVVDPLTVEVTTKRPWVSFPAYLFSSARLGIMAQAQLDASATDCANHPIGTGPFSFVSWTKNQELKGEANPDYWQIAPDGKLPTLRGHHHRLPPHPRRQRPGQRGRGG